jgi:hypothetical protein
VVDLSERHIAELITLRSPVRSRPGPPWISDEERLARSVLARRFGVLCESARAAAADRARGPFGRLAIRALNRVAVLVGRSPARSSSEVRRDDLGVHAILVWRGVARSWSPRPPRRRPMGVSARDRQTTPCSSRVVPSAAIKTRPSSRWASASSWSSEPYRLRCARVDALASVTTGRAHRMSPRRWARLQRKDTGGPSSRTCSRSTCTRRSRLAYQASNWADSVASSP